MPADQSADYLALARHHRECELAGERLAQAVAAALESVVAYSQDGLPDRLRAALDGWNAHQWPDDKASHNGSREA